MLAAMLGGSVASGLFGMLSANKAAQAQEEAARKAAEAGQAGASQSNALLSGSMALQNGYADDQMALGQENYLRDRDWQLANYDRVMGITQPYQDLGLGAIDDLGLAARNIPEGAYDAPDFADYEQSPYFDYMQAQGQDAISAAAAARGINLSSATMKESGQFATDIQGAGFGDWYGREIDGKNRQIAGSQDEYNRLMGLVGIGQGAAAQQIGASNTFTNGMANASNTMYGGAYNALRDLSGYTANNAMAMGNNIMTGANAGAQGAIGAGNAQASGYAGTNQAFQGMLGNAANIGGMASAGYFGSTAGSEPGSFGAGLSGLGSMTGGSNALSWL